MKVPVTLCGMDRINENKGKRAWNGPNEASQRMANNNNKIKKKKMVHILRRVNSEIKKRKKGVRTWGPGCHLFCFGYLWVRFFFWTIFGAFVSTVVCSLPFFFFFEWRKNRGIFVAFLYWSARQWRPPVQDLSLSSPLLSFLIHNLRVYSDQCPYARSNEVNFYNRLYYECVSKVHFDAGTGGRGAGGGDMNGLVGILEPWGMTSEADQVEKRAGGDILSLRRMMSSLSHNNKRNMA